MKKVAVKKNPTPNKWPLMWIGLGLVFAVAIGFFVYRSMVQVVDINYIGPGGSGGAMGRLGVRTSADGKGEFYNTATGKSFQFRGNIFLYMKKASDITGAQAMFIPGYYDRQRNLTDLKLMNKYGYNSVRVLLNPYEMANSTGAGVDRAYTKNVAEFINDAKSQNMYVLLDITFLPKGGGYWPKSIPSQVDPQWANMNSQSILVPGFVTGKRSFARDFVSSLKEEGADMDTVAGYNIYNEPSFPKNLKPISLTSGKFTAPNGVTYDMSSLADKERMIDESLVFFVDTVRNGIKEADSQALVNVGLFSPAYPHPDTIVRTAAIFSSSKADFVSLNVYPDAYPSVSTDQSLSAIGISGTKPVIIGAFGIYAGKVPSIKEAANKLVDFQTLTCSKYGMRGWFTYDWNMDMDPFWGKETHIYHVLESESGSIGTDGVINRSLAPIYRPDPCSKSKAIYEPSSKNPTPKPDTKVRKFEFSCNNQEVAGCVAKGATYELVLNGAESMKRVKFPSWNTANSPDSNVSHEGVKSPDGKWKTTIKSNQISGTGDYRTNVWTIDANGKSNWCRMVVLPVCK